MFTPLPASPAPRPATPEDFFARVRAHNPFTDNRINGPSAEDVDVEELNRTAFDRLIALASEAHTTRRGLGAVVLGQAGIGKSHLLSRLGRWAGVNDRACLVYLHNLQASPANLPRSLLRAVVNAFTRTEGHRFHTTPLVRMLHATLHAALGPGVHSWGTMERALVRALEAHTPRGAADAALADRTVASVLFCFYRSVNRMGQGKEDGSAAAAAVQWLRGDTVTAEQGQLLGLPPARHPDAPVGLEDNQQIKQVLVLLTALAACRRLPFLLCFDQVDNLEAEQMSALARFLEALIDSSANLLVVLAGVQDSLVGWYERRVIQASAWDRLAQFQVPLYRLTPEQARPLVQQRLQRFLEPFEELAAVRQKVFEDALFPLGSQWFAAQMRDRVEVRPRDVLNEARERWAGEQEALGDKGGPTWLAEWDPGLGKLVDQVVEARMVEHRKMATRLPDKDSMSESVAQILEQCRTLDSGYGLLEVMRLEKARGGTLPAYDLVVRQQGEGGGEIRTGLLFVQGIGGLAMFHALDRLRDDPTAPERVLMVADESGPELGSKGEEFLKDLGRRPSYDLKVLHLSLAEFATLDALHAVWNLARSEDVVATLPDGTTHLVTPEEVEQSHHRCGHYRSAPVLADLFAVPVVAPPPPPPPVGVSAAEDEVVLFDEAVLAEPAFAKPEAAVDERTMEEPVEELTVAEAVTGEEGGEHIFLEDEPLDPE